jgi:hypothetical protein
LTLCLTGNINCQVPLQEFNEILGKQQSSAFDLAVESYKKFLELNYSNEEFLTDRNSQFLKDFQSIYTSGPPNWKFPGDIQAVLNEWENSGLRKEIRLWPNENYQPAHFPDLDENDSTDSEKMEVEIDDEIIPIKMRDGQTITEPARIDSFQVSNTFGKFLHALDKCCSTDTLVSDYVEVKRIAGDISPSLMAGAYAGFGERLSDPILIRMIVAELYYFLMTKEIEIEKLKTSTNNK